MDEFLFFLRLRGVLETAPALWAAQRLLDGTPSRAHALLAHALLRQAAWLLPEDPNTAQLANSLAAHTHLPQIPVPQGPGLSEVEALLEGKDPDDIKAMLAQAPFALLRLCILLRLWTQGVFAETFLAEAERWLHTNGADPALALVAWGAHALGAEDLVDKILRVSTPSPWAAALRAHRAQEQGMDGREHLQEALRLEPSLPWAIEGLAQPPSPTPPRAARVHILFYTFNKLTTTLRTLESLLASGIGDAAITLLNNGSTSFSPAEFDAAVAAVAQGRPVEVIHVPVNIGAPAARNWLWHLPNVRQAQYVAYLDDDVLLAKGWLDRFVADLEAAPQYCVVGGKVLNPNPYRTIQYVYRYFQEVGEHHIRFTPNAPMFLDLGQYDVLRPCLSVMGCCHLFHRRRMERLGVPDFDVRFSPSQVDDLERDIQIWRHGGQVLYDGRVEIVHLQDAGSAAPKSEASWAHVLGNHRKMESKFTGNQLRHIHRAVQEAEHRAWLATLHQAWPLLPETTRHFWTEMGMAPGTHPLATHPSIRPHVPTKP